MSHTPGPWRPDIKPIVDIYVRTTGEEFGPVVATVYKHFGVEEGEANARLIAAAPELLEAAKALLEWADGPYAGSHVADMGKLALVAAQVRVAVEKAEGHE